MHEDKNLSSFFVPSFHIMQSKLHNPALSDQASFQAPDIGLDVRTSCATQAGPHC